MIQILIILAFKAQELLSFSSPAPPHLLYGGGYLGHDGGGRVEDGRGGGGGGQAATDVLVPGWQDLCSMLMLLEVVMMTLMMVEVVMEATCPLRRSRVGGSHPDLSPTRIGTSVGVSC